MGAAAARHARTVLGHVEQILAIELLCAAQALDLRLATLAAQPGDGEASAPAPGAGVAEALVRIRERVTPLGDDREPGPDLASTLAIVRQGVLATWSSRPEPDALDPGLPTRRSRPGAPRPIRPPADTDESVKPRTAMYCLTGRGQSPGEGRDHGDHSRRAALPDLGRG